MIRPVSSDFLLSKILIFQEKCKIFRITYPYFFLRKLIQSDLESQFVVRSQLGPSI